MPFDAAAPVRSPLPGLAGQPALVLEMERLLEAIGFVQRIPAEPSPIEARVIDEALRILGPNGEKWIQGQEADKQHNHCMIGAIKLARRRLKVKDDDTKALILSVLRRDGEIGHIPGFNDHVSRRFDHVREIMLRAKCEALSRLPQRGTFEL